MTASRASSTPSFPRPAHVDDEAAASGRSLRRRIAGVVAVAVAVLVVVALGIVGERSDDGVRARCLMSGTPASMCD
jgi:hypothetical protein